MTMASPDLGLYRGSIGRDLHHPEEWEVADSINRRANRRYLAPRIKDEFLLATTVKEYKYWVAQECTLVFSKGGRFYLRRAPKRGNGKYRQRVWQRLNEIFEGVPERIWFDRADRSAKYRETDTFLITLTFPRRDFVDDTWKHVVSKQMNLFNGRIKRLIPGIQFIRGYESHEDGYPHIHMVVVLPAPVRVVMINGKACMTTSLRNKIRARWGTVWDPSSRSYEGTWWNADILALDSRVGGLKYVAKYITKASKTLKTAQSFSDLSSEDRKHLLTLAMGWRHRKRTFSTTKNLRDALMNGVHNSTVSVDPNVRYGCEPVKMIGFLFGKVPDEWYQGWLEEDQCRLVYLHPSFFKK